MVYNVSDLILCALQLVRECKEVLKGGLLMKQYYQFMLRGVVTDAQGLQTNANIDEFEEDLHKMLVVSLPSAPSRRGFQIVSVRVVGFCIIEMRFCMKGPAVDFASIFAS